ncbi:MAG: hypothetical protein H6748_02425 [Spirochaetaceae bacterium]|nr:hypothetical protein [Myxococcales bacterium]MCB9722882.1 hypothetical protein [Spirochaetaceae bacterium]
MADAPSSTRKVKLRLSPQAEKYARRDAPVEARRMAARGALPLEPTELATVLLVLANDPDASVKETARASLEGLPEHVLKTVLTGPAHPALLSFLAHVHKETEKWCEAIALNPAADDATVAWLATLPHPRVVDIISQNQERMMRHEEIVDALGANPLTGRAVIERILGFLGLEERETVEDDDETLDEDEAEAAVRELLGGEMGEIAKLLASEKDEDVDEEIEGSLYAAIQKMTVMQKIKLARVGGKEARALLIKDRNRIVSSSVLGSPKLTETEVVGFAQSRSLSDELLRIIASNRDWTKNYQIKLALVTNPKTPTPQALKFLNYLQDKDLRSLMKSRDVSNNVSAQARRLLTKKGKI